MYAPARHDEITGLVNYLQVQLSAVRAAPLGLTEEQARATPCRSALSVGGIVKHTAYGLRGAAATIAADGHPEIDEAAYAAHAASFTVGPDETMAGVLAEFDAAREACLAVITAADPDAEFLAPPAPWFGLFQARSAKLRYFLVHQIEETARHAGHADILREQLDGVAVPALVLTLEGMPANDFFQPYVPAPGTIGS
ncbi:MAG TPA: DinB family protein [Microlunatus sp.]|nr:DinB family protein [Microlunatus sp.]